jgi:hypothetical protein
MKPHQLEHHGGPGRAGPGFLRHLRTQPDGGECGLDRVLRCLSVALVHRDQLLGTLGAHPDQHQYARVALAQAYAQVHAVGPDTHVVDLGQVALAECGVIGLPLGGEPGYGGRGQPGCRAEELLERRHEVAGGQAVQIQQRQHLSDPRGLARPRRQDRRGQPLALSGIRRAPSRTTSSSSETPSRTEPFSGTTVNTRRTLPTGAPTPAKFETHRSVGKVRPFVRPIHRSRSLLGEPLCGGPAEPAKEPK